MISHELLQSVLTRTHALLVQGWCQGDYAQRADGTWVSVLSPDAGRWSLAGALSASLHEHQQSICFPRVMQRFRQHLPPGHRDPEDWQDLPSTSLADVLALVERTREGLTP